MRKVFFWTATCFLLAAVGELLLQARPFPIRPLNGLPISPQVTNLPVVGTPIATPALLFVNTPTTVTVTVQITDSRLLPNGVNLLRLNANSTPSILGVMHDDGLSGDTVAKDNVYALQLNLNEAASGQVQLQVSAAFKGRLQRTLSTILSIPVWQLLSDSSMQVSFGYPPGWVSRLYGDVYTLSSTSTLPQLEGDPGNELEVTTLPLDGATSTLDWLATYYSGMIDFSQKPPTAYTNPAGVQFLIVTSAPGESSDNAVAYTLIGDHVLRVTVSPLSSFSTLFMTLLSSVRTL